MTVITERKIHQGFMPQDGIASRSLRQLFPERFIDQFCKRNSYPLGRFVPLFLAAHSSILHLHSDVVHIVRVASCSLRRRSLSPFHAFSITVSLRYVVKNRASTGDHRPFSIALPSSAVGGSVSIFLRVLCSRAAIIIRTI